MSEWCKKTFTANGLLDRIRSSTISIKEAENQVPLFPCRIAKKIPFLFLWVVGSRDYPYLWSSTRDLAAVGSANILTVPSDVLVGDL